MRKLELEADFLDLDLDSVSASRRAKLILATTSRHIFVLPLLQTLPPYPSSRHIFLSSVLSSRHFRQSHFPPFPISADRRSFFTAELLSVAVQYLGRVADRYDIMP